MVQLGTHYAGLNVDEGETAFCSTILTVFCTSLYLSFNLLVCLLACPAVCHACLSVCELSVSVGLSVFLPVCLSVSLSVYLSILRIKRTNGTNRKRQTSFCLPQLTIENQN